MAKITIYGIEELEKKLQKLERDSDKIIEEAVYIGAGIVADEMNRQIDNLRIGSDRKWETNRRQMQKRGLKKGLGITPIRNDKGYINAKVGFDGYNEQGQANSMIARIFESGNSFTSKQPFIKKTKQATQMRVEKEIETFIEKKIQEIERG